MVTLATYAFIFFIIVVLVFFILYWGFSHSINEFEALAVALTAGTIYLAIDYKNIVQKYYNEMNRTQIQFTIIFTTLMVVLTIIILLAVGFSLITFGKTRHCDIFKF